GHEDPVVGAVINEAVNQVQHGEEGDDDRLDGGDDGAQLSAQLALQVRRVPDQGHDERKIHGLPPCRFSVPLRSAGGGVTGGSWTVAGSLSRSRSRGARDARFAIERTRSVVS